MTGISEKSQGKLNPWQQCPPTARAGHDCPPTEVPPELTSCLAKRGVKCNITHMLKIRIFLLYISTNLHKTTKAFYFPFPKEGFSLPADHKCSNPLRPPQHIRQGQPTQPTALPAEGLIPLLPHFLLSAGSASTPQHPSLLSHLWMLAQPGLSHTQSFPAMAREANRTLSHPDNPKKGPGRTCGDGRCSSILLQAWHSSAQPWSIG